MRTRRRIALLLASAAALGVGLIALPASAAASPPAVPTCTPRPSTDSDCCVKGTVTAVDGSLGAAYENSSLGTRVRSAFSPGDRRDNQSDRPIRRRRQLNLAAVPGTCTAATLSGKTIQQAYNACGPGPGGSNTYLSPPGNVSGVGSTTVTGIDACTMIFKGANNNQVLIYARAPIGNPSSECNNPGTNTAGSATVVFTGTISQQPAASPYGPTLTVPNTHTANPSLDDFGATITRGSVVRARCPAGASPLSSRRCSTTPPRERPTRSHRRTPVRRITVPHKGHRIPGSASSGQRMRQEGRLDAAPRLSGVPPVPPPVAGRFRRDVHAGPAPSATPWWLGSPYHSPSAVRRAAVTGSRPRMRRSSTRSS